MYRLLITYPLPFSVVLKPPMGVQPLPVLYVSSRVPSPSSSKSRCWFNSYPWHVFGHPSAVTPVYVVCGNAARKLLWLLPVTSPSPFASHRMAFNCVSELISMSRSLSES